MRIIKTSNANLRVNHLIYLGVVVLTVSLSCLFFDAYLYDVLAYHGPFTAIATKIPGLSDFKLDSNLLDRYKGFAPLWRFALYPSFFLNLPRLMILPNIIILILFSIVLIRTKILPWHLGVCGIFMFPITLFAFRSGYQDFFVGMITASALLLLLSSIYRQNLSSTALAIALLALASFTKYQGLMQALIIIMVGYLSTVLFQCIDSSRSKFTLKCFLVMTLGTIIICSHSFYNLILYSNPFYPIAVGPFSGPEANYIDATTYTSFLYPFHGLVDHFLSTTELDWVLRGAVPSYTIDMARSQTQYGGLLDPSQQVSFVRTGGTYGPLYILITIIFIHGVFRSLNNIFSHNKLNYFDFLIAFTGLYLVICSFLPQSHELRYYLSIFVLISVLSISYLQQFGLKSILKPSILFFLSISLLFNFAQPVHSTIKNGINYAITYPERDLPDPEQCYGFDDITNPASRFACRLQLRKAKVNY